MPEYLKDINYIVTAQDAEQLMGKATNMRDKALVVLLYLTGARPIELCQMKKESIWKEGVLTKMKIPTAKLGAGAKKKFVIPDRTLEFGVNTPYLEIVHSWRNSLACKLKESLLGLTNPDRVRHIIYKLSDNTLCPYHFRHSRFTKMARKGASIDELMYWKGAMDIKSVTPYLRGKPIGRDMDID